MKRPRAKHPTTKKRYTYEDKTRSYAAIHWYIRKTYGNAYYCEASDCLKISQRYEWSNISKLYSLDRSDWKQLCKSCHSKMDMTEKGYNNLNKYIEKYKYIHHKPVGQYNPDGTLVKIWESRVEIARYFGITGASISDVLSKREHVYRGYLWRDLTKKVS